MFSQLSSNEGVIDLYSKRHQSLLDHQTYTSTVLHYVGCGINQNKYYTFLSIMMHTHVDDDDAVYLYKIV